MRAVAARGLGEAFAPDKISYPPAQWGNLTSKPGRCKSLFPDWTTWALYAPARRAVKGFGGLFCHLFSLIHVWAYGRMNIFTLCIYMLCMFDVYVYKTVCPKERLRGKAIKCLI